LWYGEPDAIANAIGYAEHCSRSHDAVIRDGFHSILYGAQDDENLYMAHRRLEPCGYCSARYRPGFTKVGQGADGMPLAITCNVLGPDGVPDNTSNLVVVGRFPVATAMVLKSWVRAK
jgi:hypothetical protein